MGGTRMQGASESAPEAKPTAYSYLRFSTPEQAAGDSFRRQTAAAEAYAAAHGLDLDERLNLRDAGVSAFRGANATTGALSLFRRAVEDGLIEPGSFLLVENVDRISRQNPLDALPVFIQIINAGITIVTLHDGQRFSRDEYQANPGKLFLTIGGMIRANEESVVKSRRGRATWENKRKEAKERPLTARTPGWLHLDKATGTFQVVEERAAVVRSIFSRYTKGWGQARITQDLNRKGVPVFGRADQWHSTYVAKILDNPAVIGTMTPHVTEYEEGRKVRKAQAPVKGYFPPIVKRGTFLSVQAQRKAKQAPRDRTSSHRVANLLGGLAHCPVCGGTMTRVSKGPNGGRPRLVCVRAKNGAGCTYRAVPLEQVEAAILGNIGQIIGEAPSGDAGLDEQWDTLETRLVAVTDALSNIFEAIETGGPSPALTARLRQWEEERGRLEEEQRTLAARMAATADRMVDRRMADLEEAATAVPLDRRRVNALLRQLLDGVTVDYRSGLLLFAWTHGGETDVMYGWPKAESGA